MKPALTTPVLLTLAVALFSLSAQAAELKVTVVNDKGEPVKDAVAYVAKAPQGVGKGKPPKRVIDQIDKEFVDTVTVVQVGSAVTFPNHDDIRHHVYSFSPAKQFELPLYLGTPAEPVVFDQPGVVTLGCNIHDWMSAYVLVVDTPFYALTDEQGSTVIKDLPVGDYEIEVWDKQLRGPASRTRTSLTVAEGGENHLDFTIKQKKLWRPHRAPTMDNMGY